MANRLHLAEDVKGTDPQRLRSSSRTARMMWMPSLAETARRLTGPEPPGADPDAYAVLRAVWGTYLRAATAWRSVVVPGQPTRERWAQLQAGTPLLDESMILWEAAPLQQQYRRLRRVFCSPTFSTLEDLGELRRLLTIHPTESAHWARSFLRCEVNDPRPEVLLGGYMIQPFLYVYARRVQPDLNQEEWRRSRCPVCGGRPYHGYLHSESRQKTLVCGKCQFPWMVPRLKCPFCENTMQDSLGYLYQEEVERYRIDYCVACRSILPITLSPESGRPFPLIDHLTSMSLKAAVERRQYD